MVLKHASRPDACTGSVAKARGTYFVAIETLRLAMVVVRKKLIALTVDCGTYDHMVLTEQTNSL